MYGCILFYSNLHPFSKPLFLYKVAETFYSILFYSILFYSILFYSPNHLSYVRLYSVLF